ncbi:hypothetical protein NA78x_001966 [Anatilimnocola sp. NA78]|uniref:hypothetical protein n=1 Tax=Anatilimnocola sp. NA78 TaxID=3415683 RepID=UPI003CE5A446
MRYAVFADVSRRLTGQEQSAVCEALEVNVPGSGCVGRDKLVNDEVYFCVEASCEEDARARARDYMNTVLKHAGLDVQYTLSLQPAR